MLAFTAPMALRRPDATWSNRGQVTRRPVVRPPAVRSRSARQPVTCVWVERSAKVVIELDRLQCFDYYIDLEAMPQWSPWLKKVEVDRKDSDVSQWTLAARGMQVSWKARNTEVVRGEIISWKSETGLPNKGRVLFDPEETDPHKSVVTLAIQFDVPSAVARILDNDFIGQYVESTLAADLKRFRMVALRQHRHSLVGGAPVSPVASSE